MQVSNNEESKKEKKNGQSFVQRKYTYICLFVCVFVCVCLYAAKTLKTFPLSAGRHLNVIRYEKINDLL